MNAHTLNQIDLFDGLLLPSGATQPGLVRPSDMGFPERSSVTSHTVAKPVEMSSFRPESSRVTMWARKAWIFLTAYALNGRCQALAQDGVFRVPLLTLIKDARFTSRDRRHLISSLIELQKVVVTWAGSARSSDSGDRCLWASTSLLGAVAVRKDEGGRVWLEWGYSHLLWQQIQAHRHYYSISLDAVARIKHGSTLALYEIACRYLTSPGGLTFRLPWQEWIPYLSGESSSKAAERHLSTLRSKGKMPSSAYDEYRYARRDLFAPAIAELNSLDIPFNVELVVASKIGRSIHEVQFKITKRSPPAAPVCAPADPVLNRSDRVNLPATRPSAPLPKEFISHLAATSPSLHRIAIRSGARIPSVADAFESWLRSTAHELVPSSR